MFLFQIRFMHIHETSNSRSAATLPTEQLRAEFLVSGLFRPGEATFSYWETDRTVVGGIVPGPAVIDLPNPPEVRSAFFLERREAGVINLGGPGSVTADGTTHSLDNLDALYLGRGVKAVSFSSRSADQPARFYFLSYPAHTAYPVRYLPFKEAKGDRLGTRESANERTLYKLIHPAAFPSCQLVMGFTRMEPGSVWNTMPPHTHLRRSEVYCYFNLLPTQAVFHFMGTPKETRHLVLRDLDVVLSPPWSIHSGVGTAAYTFVWGMGGENQEFADMDPVPVATLR
jgi:4-deoxy-L-threo-5-hexosulose-uronate ketol-isomerase